MIPQLLSFQNEFRSRVKFVLHSHDKIKWLSLRRSRLRGFRARSDTQVPLALDYTICDFQSGTKFVFSLHDTRIKISYQNKSFIRNENWDELILE